MYPSNARIGTQEKDHSFQYGVFFGLEIHLTGSNCLFMSLHDTTISNSRSNGVVAVICKDGQFLVIKRATNVIAPGKICFPGGKLRPGEAEKVAVIRELKEELGLTVPSSWLQKPWTLTEHQAGGRNTVTIFSLPWPAAGEPTDQPPPLNPDQLEIVATAWMVRGQALQHVLPAHLRRYLEEQS